eukprot:scaffold13609_cov106-Isochrysis_galbana.AAC.9
MAPTTNQPDQQINLSPPHTHPSCAFQRACSSLFQSPEEPNHRRLDGAPSDSDTGRHVPRQRRPFKPRPPTPISSIFLCFPIPEGERCSQL